MSTTTKKEKTHIQLQREAFELDQQFILRKSKMTEDDYKHLIFELGCQFVEYHISKCFDKAPAEFIKREINGILFSTFYWKWWLAEWKYIQNKVVKDVMHDPAYFSQPKSKSIFTDLYIEYNKLRMKQPDIIHSFNNIIERHLV
jgi:hypothetical protein